MITQEQRLARKKGLFSSDIARIMCGHSVSVAQDKLGLADYSEELEDLAEIRIGKLVEPFILAAYENLYGCELTKSPDTIMHPSIPWMGVHLDALRPAKAKNIEAKTAGVYNIPLWGKPGTDNVPEYVLWQGHAGMACTNAMSVDIPVCFITMEAMRDIILHESPPIHIYTVERDYVLEAALIKKSQMVWDCIQKGETPPPENLAEVKLIYARAVEEYVIADANILASYERLIKAVADRKLAEDEIDKEKFILQSYMGEAAELRDANEALLATWRNDSDGLQLDKKKLEEEQPAIFKKYLIPRPGPRKFLPKEKKKKK